MLSWIAVGDAQLLIGLNTQDVRAVVATILIKLNRSCWRIPLEVAKLLPPVVVPSLM